MNTTAASNSVRTECMPRQKNFCTSTSSFYRGTDKVRPGLEKEKENYCCSCCAMRSKETACVKSGHKTGGKQSGAGKRKSATALANAAGLRAVKALAAKRKRPQETENEIDELREEGEDGED